MIGNVTTLKCLKASNPIGSDNLLVTMRHVKTMVDNAS